MIVLVQERIDREDKNNNGSHKSANKLIDLMEASMADTLVNIKCRRITKPRQGEVWCSVIYFATETQRAQKILQYLCGNSFHVIRASSKKIPHHSDKVLP
jgi:hypothetical protein